jgi:hypothetical protein
MPRSSEAIGFLRRLSAFAERLAARDIVVHTLDSEWGTFGSWKLAVRDGNVSDKLDEELAAGAHFQDLETTHYSFVWDGRDHDLVIEATVATPISVSGGWKTVLARSLESSDEAIAVTEEFLMKQVPREP